MLKCFHGTDFNGKIGILNEGFKILETLNNGKHFGNGIYLTTSRESATDYGEHVIDVEVDEQYLMNIPSMTDFNKLEMTAMFHGGVEAYLRNNGFKGFKMTTIEGEEVILIYDVSVIEIIK